MHAPFFDFVLILICGITITMLLQQEFGVFLRQNEPFDYIIDAANVAYQNQNYHDGRFKYEQVIFFNACLFVTCFVAL